MLLREKAITKKPGKSGKRKKTDEKEEEVEDAQEDEWDVAAPQPKTTAAAKAKGKASKGGAAEETQAAQAKRLAKTNQKTDQDNERTLGEAVKALAALTPQVKALITVKTQAQKLFLPVESIEAALQDTQEKKTAANNVVMAGNHVAAHVPLPSRLFSKRQS